MNRPRLNLSAPTAPPPAVVELDPLATAEKPVSQPEPANPTRWVRDTRSSPANLEQEPVEPNPAVGEYRRSSGAKKNRTVSVPAEHATTVRARATAERWSVTDVVFLAVEQYRERLRAAPALPGRALGPKPLPIARAHLVLYLTDDEWNAWKTSAEQGGLGTTSRLVSHALESLPGDMA